MRLLPLLATIATALRAPPRPLSRPELRQATTVLQNAPIFTRCPSPAIWQRPSLARAVRCAIVASSSSPTSLGQLWPNTLCKFWGLHAFAWANAAAAAYLLTHSFLLLPIVAANAVLAWLLYRTEEDVGPSLAASAGAYFGAHAATLWLAPLASLFPHTVRAFRLLRLWHAALAMGSFAFAIKAALKDRLFKEGGEMRRATMAASSSGSRLPMLAFINRQAGAKIGARVGEVLTAAAEAAAASGRVLSVVDLSTTAPSDALRAFSVAHGAFRVVVFGGDGSASWVLGAIEESDLRGWDGAPYKPAVALVPLGTGNDLARVLDWGKGVRLDALPKRLVELDEARVAVLDRWAVRGAMPEGTSRVVMSNYMSIGVDAKAALLWSRLARARPALFKFRLLNKLWYIVCGTPEFLLHSYRRLSDRVELTCDGERIDIPRGIEGLMVLNT
jgi:hypothetical protein